MSNVPMTEKEKDFIKERLPAFLSSQKEGSSLATILDFLDYINKVRYVEKEIQPLIKELLRCKMIKVVDGKYYGCSNA